MVRNMKTWKDTERPLKRTVKLKSKDNTLKKVKWEKGGSIGCVKISTGMKKTSGKIRSLSQIDQILSPNAPL